MDSLRMTKGNFDQKIQELRKSIKDNQFLDDLKETIKDFNIIDLEEWPE